MFERVLNEFQLSSKVKAIVTDNCNTMICAFENKEGEEAELGQFSDTDDEDVLFDLTEDDLDDVASVEFGSIWSGCRGHKLQIVQRKSFNQMKNTASLKNVLQLDKAAKRLASVFNRTGANKLLTSSLKQEIDIRFDSKFLLYQSIEDNIFPLRNLTNEIVSGVEELVGAIDSNYSLFNSVRLFLKKFYDTRIALSDDKQTNINLVVKSYLELLRHCEPTENEDSRVAILKLIFKKNLKEKYEPNEIHYRAALLTPKFRGLKGVPNEVRSSVICKLRDELLLQSNVTIQTPESSTPSAPIDGGDSVFEDDFALNCREEDELGRYLQDNFSKAD